MFGWGSMNANVFLLFKTKMCTVLSVVVEVIYCLPCSNYCVMSLQKILKPYNIPMCYFLL